MGWFYLGLGLKSSSLPVNSVGGVVAEVTSDEVLGTGANGAIEGGTIDATRKVVAAVAVDTTRATGSITDGDDKAIAVAHFLSSSLS